MSRLPTDRCVASCLLFVCLICVLGCRSTPYQYGQFHAEGIEPPPLIVEHGEADEKLDKLRDIARFPSRLFRLGREVDEAEEARQAEEQVAEYLEQNDLTDVYVAINQYEPRDQWRRLRENERVGAGWRYSLGALSVVGYTLLPGRVFGRDSYNPYTNTLSVNSGNSTQALFEAAYAKDVHARNNPGSYVAISSLPGLSLARQTRATSDVVGYLQAQEEWDLEVRSYPQLYARIGSSSANIAGPFVPSLVNPVLGLGGRIAGHAAGRLIADQRDREIQLVRTERDQNAAIMAELFGKDDVELVDGSSDGHAESDRPVETADHTEAIP